MSVESSLVLSSNCVLFMGIPFCFPNFPSALRNFPQLSKSCAFPSRISSLPYSNSSSLQTKFPPASWEFVEFTFSFPGVLPQLSKNSVFLSKHFPSFFYEFPVVFLDFPVFLLTFSIPFQELPASVNLSLLSRYFCQLLGVSTTLWHIVKGFSMLVVHLHVVMCPVVLWCPVLSYMTDFVIGVLTHLVLIFLTIL